MTAPFSEELVRAKLLLEKGEYRDALNQLEAIKKRERFSENDQIRYLLLESQISVKLGKLDQALALALEVMEKAHKRGNLMMVVDALIAIGEISWRSHKITEGLAALEEGDRLIARIEQDCLVETEVEIKRRKAELIQNKAVLCWYGEELDKAHEYHQRSLAIFKLLEDKKGIADSLHGLGNVGWSKGDLDRALEYSRQSLAIREELGHQHDIASSLNSIATIYNWKGDQDRSLEMMHRSLAIKEKVEDADTDLALLNLGCIYLYKGDHDQALDYSRRGLAVAEKLDDRRDISFALSLIGEIYGLKGDLDQSLEYHQKCLDICEQLDRKDHQAETLINIGFIYRMKGNLTLALDYLLRSLKILEGLGNNLAAALNFYHLEGIAIDKGDLLLAKSYLEELGKIDKKTGNRMINQRYRLGEALLRKASKRARDKLEAQEMLEKLVGEEIADHFVTVTAMIHLCDLLIFELKMTGEEELLENVKDLINRLLSIAEKQSSYPLLVETYLLQSRFALIDMDVEQAKQHLQDAQTIAEEKGLQNLAETILHERELLSNHLHKWESIINSNPTRREMIELTIPDDLLESLIQKTVSTLTHEEKKILSAEAPFRNYTLVHIDLLLDKQGTERSKFRVGIAQIGLSGGGDILEELYEEREPGLFRLREDKVGRIRSSVRELIEEAHAKNIHILLFPELTIDFNYTELLEDLMHLTKTYGIYIIPGSYHHLETKRNLCKVIGPDGVFWEQEKHIPAIIHHQGKRYKEGIEVRSLPRKITICSSEFGRIAVIICRDFLDMDLRVELKNSDPPVDLIFNPAFTPVTADFRAAHFDARRSIYAYCFFANVAEFGDSLIYTPEKERTERYIPSGEENLIYKDVDLFKLRSERKRWEIEVAKEGRFIQSTRIS